MKSPSSLRNNRRSHPAVGGPFAIHVDARYGATPQRVFNAWLDPGVAGRWLFATATRPMTHVEIDARVAGRFRFVEQREDGRAEYSGEYLEIIAHRRLVLGLALADRPGVLTRVTVEIEPRETGCKLSLTHEDVPFDLLRGMEARWSGILYGLGVTLGSYAGGPMSRRRSIAPNLGLRRLKLAQAVGRHESRPSRNPRSE